MVHVERSGGRLGNQMFEYAFGRIIAEHFNYKFTHNLQIPELSENFKLPDSLGGKEIHDPVQNVNGIITYSSDLLDSILNDTRERKIICNGYFQNYNYYKNYKHKLKKWFYINNKEFDFSNCIAVHIRKGDFKNHSHFDVPDNYFLDIIKSESFDKIFLASDEPSHNIVQKILTDYKDKAILVEDTPFNTLKQFACFKKLILSFGTFSWWMGFLSDASRIYLPNKFFPNNIDLRVTDEERYILV